MEQNVQDTRHLCKIYRANKLDHIRLCALRFDFVDYVVKLNAGKY